MDYRVIVTAAGTTSETIVHAECGSAWTSATSIHWARVQGYRYQVGTRIAIDRRRGQAMYQPHRRYLVTASGVQRTDR